MDLVRDGYPIKSASVLSEVYEERRNQDAKWGEQNHPNGTGEAFRKVADDARKLCDRKHKSGVGTWQHILMEEVAEAFSETDPVKLRAELVQVAAVAVNWIEAIDRRAAALPAPVAGDQVTTERANTLPVGSIVVIDIDDMNSRGIKLAGDFPYPLTKFSDTAWKRGANDSETGLGSSAMWRVLHVGNAA